MRCQYSSPVRMSSFVTLSTSLFQTHVQIVGDFDWGWCLPTDSLWMCCMVGIHMIGIVAWWPLAAIWLQVNVTLPQRFLYWSSTSVHDWGFVRWNIFGAAANLCKKLQWNASKPRFSTRLLLCDQMKAEGDAAQVQASKTIKTNQNQQKYQNW